MGALRRAWLILFTVLTSRVIFGSQSTASQPVGSGCPVHGGRELVARSDSVPPDSQDERGKQTSDENKD